jgi:hypothetical protein
MASDFWDELAVSDFMAGFRFVSETSSVDDAAEASSLFGVVSGFLRQFLGMTFVRLCSLSASLVVLWSIRLWFLKWTLLEDVNCLLLRHRPGCCPSDVCFWCGSPLALISQRVCHNLLVPGFTDGAGFRCDGVVKTENLDWIFLLDVSLLLRFTCDASVLLITSGSFVFVGRIILWFLN